MNEHTPNQSENRDAEKELKREAMIALARELGERTERISFPGIDPEEYSKMKATDAEFPGYTTPIDELVERCKDEGIKVVFGEHPESGNAYVLPCQSDDLGMDGIRLHQLQIPETRDEQFKKLIVMSKEWRADTGV